MSDARHAAFSLPRFLWRALPWCAAAAVVWKLTLRSNAVVAVGLAKILHAAAGHPAPYLLADERTLFWHATLFAPVVGLTLASYWLRWPDRVLRAAAGYLAHAVLTALIITVNESPYFPQGDYQTMLSSALAQADYLVFGVVLWVLIAGPWYERCAADTEGPSRTSAGAQPPAPAPRDPANEPRCETVCSEPPAPGNPANDPRSRSAAAKSPAAEWGGSTSESRSQSAGTDLPEPSQRDPAKALRSDSESAGPELPAPVSAPSNAADEPRSRPPGAKLPAGGGRGGSIEPRSQSASADPTAVGQCGRSNKPQSVPAGTDQPSRSTNAPARAAAGTRESAAPITGARAAVQWRLCCVRGLRGWALRVVMLLAGVGLLVLVLILLGPGEPRRARYDLAAALRAVPFFPQPSTAQTGVPQAEQAERDSLAVAALLHIRKAIEADEAAGCGSAALWYLSGRLLQSLRPADPEQAWRFTHQAELALQTARLTRGR